MLVRSQSHRSGAKGQSERNEFPQVQGKIFDKCRDLSDSHQLEYILIRLLLGISGDLANSQNYKFLIQSLTRNRIFQTCYYAVLSSRSTIDQYFWSANRNQEWVFQTAVRPELKFTYKVDNSCKYLCCPTRCFLFIQIKVDTIYHNLKENNFMERGAGMVWDGWVGGWGCMEEIAKNTSHHI